MKAEHPTLDTSDQNSVQQRRISQEDIKNKFAADPESPLPLKIRISCLNEKDENSDFCNSSSSDNELENKDHNEEMFTYALKKL